ncbi:MAG: HlyD family type I secretion periplasmic adaptor subunit [Cyanobacteria bacterium J06638_22]
MRVDAKDAGGETTSDPSDLDRLAPLTDRIRPKFASTLLLWLIAAFFVIFLVWAALTELDRTVRGEGRVIPSSRLQVVSNLEGGIVDGIFVNVGDLVEPGDELVRLDRTLSGAELGSNQSELNALRAKVARLEAEVAGRTPQFPEANDPTTREQVLIEQTLYASRMADLASLTQAAEARVTQSRRGVTEAQARHAAAIAARNSAQAEVELMGPLVSRGIEPRLSLIQAESRLRITSSEADAAAAAISRAQASTLEAQASLVQARQNWRARAADELARVQAEYASLRRTMPALVDRLERTSVRAPLQGRINRVLVSTVGATVRPGDPLVEIVPSQDGLIVEAAIKPADIGQVRLDQEARVSMSAYDSTVYGSLDGRVVTISPDTTVDEQTGQPFYTVRVITDGELLDSEGTPVLIGAGMTAEVSLLGEQQTILDYILTPITRLSRSALRE